LALREYYIKSGDEDLRKIGESIENSSQELKQSVTTAVQQIEKTKNIVRDILMEQDKKIDTILNDKKYQKKDKKKTEGPEKVFFSLKDHFDQNVGEPHEEQKATKAGSDEDDGFFDAQDQYTASVS
jgi:predicted ribosome quality control (RQC) complex YloA/Tae2 family protein